MMPSRAILQVADTGPLESLVVMLRSIGIQCYLPSSSLKNELRRIGCDTVLDIESLVAGMGYERPFYMPQAGLADMARTDTLYVDVKAHRCHDKVVSRWPILQNRVLWYRINGGKPEHVIKAGGEDCGDEINPPCPILTPNQWYVLTSSEAPYKWEGKAYACWPPFYRFDEYQGERFLPPTSPICLIHNLQGWGYGRLIEPFKAMGVRMYGVGSPDGLIQHHWIRDMLGETLAYVHLKSSDAPGYALYEALAAACPIICTRRLIWRCRMEDLLVPGVTCLTFDRETHEGLTDDDVMDCTKEVGEHLERLRDPGFNKQIGQAGRERLKDVMWNETKDSASLLSFIQTNFCKE